MKKFDRRGGFKTLTLPYRSGLEDRIAEQLDALGVPKQYESFQIHYVVPASQHRYIPDFVLPNGIIIEGKGIFSAEDRQKMLLIKKQYPNLDIRFVFSNAKTKIYPGSKTTVGQWCDKNGFPYSSREIPLSWLKEPAKPTEGLCPKGGGK